MKSKILAGLAMLVLGCAPNNQRAERFENLPTNPMVRIVGDIGSPKEIIYIRQVHEAYTEGNDSTPPLCATELIKTTQKEIGQIYDALVARGVTSTLQDEGITPQYLSEIETEIAKHKLEHELIPQQAKSRDNEFRERFNDFDFRILHGEIPIAPADSLEQYEMVMNSLNDKDEKEEARLQRVREDATMTIIAQSPYSILRYGAMHRFDEALAEYNRTQPKSKRAHIVEITPRSLIGKPCGVNINQP